WQVLTTPASGDSGRLAALEYLNGPEWFDFFDKPRASLVGVDLRPARPDAAGANLTGASLPGADLRQANFGKADLTNVNFLSANLENAIFDDTNVRGTNFRNVKLRG